MFLFIFSLIFATILDVNGQCTLIEEQIRVYEHDDCTAKIFCDETSENLMDIVKNWHCIRTGNRYYDNYREVYDEELVSNYNLYLYIRDIDTNISEDPLNEVIDASTNVKVLNIEKGNLVSVPIVIGSLVKLTELSLTYNKVEAINLRKVSAGGSMIYLNVSHNCISSIEEDLVGSSVLSSITTIDLSYNELESIPDNYFSKFPQLIYLDLSFNSLKQLDILTFEGIVQLETLHLSNNKISEIGHNFARFRNLKELTLDNNQLTSLTDFNFRTLISLEKLNLSSNLIKHIEDRSLATIINLKELDLSHNKIIVIRQTFFENKINMIRLSISHNDIEHIEEGAFKTTNISYFDVRCNRLSGSIEYNTFQGISVESLDLSTGKLTKLGDKAFSSMSQDLKYLNLSTNLLETIAQSAFQSLQKLSKLDLSSNNLTDVDFNTSDLIYLTEYYLQNNKIKKVTPNMFINMTKLVKLDISQNKIVDIELNSFIELINLKELNVSGNNFVNSLTANIFRGLNGVQFLDLSNTRLMSCLNESFSGMISLTFLNVSHSQLEILEYETFKATGAIKIIDLSYNTLENFHVNTSSIKQLSELYLSHNKLKNVTTETFKNLRLLNKLSLASNNIFYIDSSGFQALSHLRYLDLFSNINLHIKSDVFNNLVLSEVSLKKVHQQFNFENSVNTSIATLILSHCEIDDIDSVFVYNIKNILKLDISSNKIKKLDKGSFQNMAAMNWLDISFNMISTIQPGTFLTNNMVNTLNLYGNNLQSLKFGALDGLRNLRVLNLSNNEIHSFNVKLLHTSPYLNQLFLENNNLVSINFRELSKTRVQLVTIGGNKIPCDALADWHILNDGTLNVTAEKFDFNSENIYGMGCITSSLQEKNKIENVNVNVTSELIEIKETIGQLYNYLRMSLNGTFSKMIAYLNNRAEFSDKVAANLNQSQLPLNEEIKNMLNENINLLPQLVNTSHNIANDVKSMVLLLEINNNLTKLGNIQKELLETLVSNKTFQRQENLNSIDIKPKLQYDAEPLEDKLDKNTLVDIKLLLYFIAVCLASVILFCVVALVYKYLYRQASHRRRINHLYDSGQSVSNGLEME